MFIPFIINKIIINNNHNNNEININNINNINNNNDYINKNINIDVNNNLDEKLNDTVKCIISMKSGNGIINILLKEDLDGKSISNKDPDNNNIYYSDVEPGYETSNQILVFD